MSNRTEIIPAQDITPLIHSIRDQRVILDNDLASLYKVPTKALNQAVRRNREKFPEDLLFQLTWEEAALLPSLRSQFVTLKRGRHLKCRPFAFTGHGALMAVSRVSSRVNSVPKANAWRRASLTRQPQASPRKTNPAAATFASTTTRTDFLPYLLYKSGGTNLRLPGPCRLADRRQRGI
ncbi:MAG: ORF6N domain-containing protein [Verrucomicrobia bacterium]|nr:ORF6N domain-containing protein [Verrucomicrobiota bacterium]